MSELTQMQATCSWDPHVEVLFFARFQHIERVRRRAPTLLVVDDEAPGKMMLR